MELSDPLCDSVNRGLNLGSLDVTKCFYGNIKKKGEEPFLGFHLCMYFRQRLQKALR